MPGPAAVFAVPAGLMAMKRLALRVSAYYCTPEVASAATVATLTTLVAKYIWAQIPHWIKEDISFRTIFWSNYKKNDKEAADEKDDDEMETREELTHLSSILQSIHRYTKSMEEGAVEIPQFHAAVLAYIQWSRTMKYHQLLQHSQQQNTLQATNYTTIPRDLGYETAGTAVDLEEEVRTLVHQEALEFATWAYHRDSNKLTRILQERNYKMIIHDTSTRPGFVAFFVAISELDDKRQIVIGIRGTSTLEDIVTDCCGHAVPLRHEDGIHEERGSIEVEAEKPHEIRLSRNWSGENHDDEDSDDTNLNDFNQVEIVSGHERIHVKNDDGDYHIRCHEGMLLSAQRLCRRIQSLVKTLAVDAEYRILLSGHSLGAGVATLAGLILRSQYPSIEDRLQVCAFAPPPVLDHDSALASSTYVTSFVHNADLIPRCSLFNLAILLKGLRHIHERLDERGMNPTGPKTTAAFIKHLFEKPNGSYTSDSSSSDDDASNEPNENQEPVERDESKTISAGSVTPLTTFGEWQEAIEAGTPDIRKSEHLFVAGRVLLVYCPWTEEARNLRPFPLSGGASEKLNEQEQEEENNVTPPGGQQSPSLMRCIETDGTSPALRGVEADSPRLFTDHVTSAYYEALGMDYHFD